MMGSSKCAMYFRHNRLWQQRLLLVAFVGIRYVFAKSSNLITGELEVFLPDGLPGEDPPVFVVRDGEKTTPIMVPDNEVGRLMSYRGYTVQMRAAAEPTPPSPATPRAPRKRAAKPGRGLLQSQDGVSTASSYDPSRAVPGTEFTRVDSIDIIGPVDNAKAVTMGNVSLTSIIYLLSFCGWKAPVNASAFRSMWLNTNRTPPTAYTMQNYWANCSNGAAKFSNTSDIILEVPLDCGSLVSFSGSCSHTMIRGLLSMADDYASRVLGRPITPERRIAVLPREAVGCQWQSYSSYGCRSGSCIVWIAGGEAGRLASYMRAIGRNFGLMTSYSMRNQTGEQAFFVKTLDDTCSMGSGDTCYNVPNQWRLGWAKPVVGGDLNATNFPAGAWKTFQLPYATRNMRNHIRLMPTWAVNFSTEIVVNNERIFYVSLRKRETFDALSTNVAPIPGRVLVHWHYENPVEKVVVFRDSFLEAVLDVDDMYSVYNPMGFSPTLFNIVVHVRSINFTTGAVVGVCRQQVETESSLPGLCGDGLDNDCDGAIDAQDTDCWAASLDSPPPRARRAPHASKSPKPKKTVRPPSSKIG